MAKEKAEEKKDEVEEIKNIVNIEESGPCKKKISVEVPEEKIKAALDEQYTDLRKDAEVPGFRKGRAPLRLLEKRFGSDITNQVKLKMLFDASDAAIKDNEIEVLGDPEIDHENIDLPETGSMKFDFEVEVRPEFDLPELEGIAVEKPKIEVSDEMINTEIEAMQKRVGIWTPKDGAVDPEDQVVANVILDIEGVDENEKQENVEIFARKKGFVSGVAVEDLDKLLKGAKPGDVKKTSVDVPATYFNETYRGKKIDIEITVKDVKQLEPAPIDEAFLGRLGVADEDELRDMLGDSMKQQAENQSRSGMAQQVYDYLLEKINLDLPQDIVADQSVSILQRQYTNLLMQGSNRDQIDAQMAELRSSSEEQAISQLKTFFIMNKIADKFEITVTEEEINGQIAQAAAMRGRRPEKMREELAKDGSLAQFSIQIREQKCIEKILETAKIKEVDAKTVAKKTAKKTTAKKPAAKKTEAKPAAKKTETKKTETKKPAAKKATAKKTEAKKTETKKATAKKKTTKKKTDK